MKEMLLKKKKIFLNLEFSFQFFERRMKIFLDFEKKFKENILYFFKNWGLKASNGKYF